MLSMDVLANNPFRSPAWPWEAAAELVRGAGNPDLGTDSLIGRLLQFQLAAAQAPQDDPAPQQLDPDLFAAHRIYQEHGLQRDEIEARLLAGESVEVIAVKAGVPAAVVCVFGNAFYAVAGHLAARDWIHSEAIALRRCPADGPIRGDVWRWSGYVGGPHLIDIVIDEDLGRPPDPAVPDRATTVARLRLHVLGLWADQCADKRTRADIVRRQLVLSRDALLREIQRDPRMAIYIRILRLDLGFAPVPGLEVTLPLRLRGRYTRKQKQVQAPADQPTDQGSVLDSPVQPEPTPAEATNPNTEATDDTDQSPHGN